MIPFLPPFVSGCFVLLAFSVWTNPRQVNIAANRWLAVFLGCIALVLLDDEQYIPKNHSFSWIIELVFNASILSLAPTLYLTVSYFVTPGRKFMRSDIWHFLLLFIVLALSILSYLMPQSKVQVGASSNFLLDFFVISLLLAPLVAYWLLSHSMLIAHQRHVLLFVSTIETVDLAWLRNFLWGLAVMMLTWGCQLLFPLLQAESIYFIVYLLSAFYLAYHALQQKEIFSERKDEISIIQSLIEVSQQPDLPRKQVLSEGQLSALHVKMMHLMAVEKPYLDAELNLPKLAKMMELNSHELSYLINVGFENNFYGFVNNYRVEESKILLLDPKFSHLSMVGIAYQSGFNSKTVFNTAFKKMVGVSPSVFQKGE